MTAGGGAGNFARRACQSGGKMFFFQTTGGDLFGAPFSKQKKEYYGFLLVPMEKGYASRC